MSEKEKLKQAIERLLQDASDDEKQEIIDSMPNEAQEKMIVEEQKARRTEQALLMLLSGFIGGLVSRVTFSSAQNGALEGIIVMIVTLLLAVGGIIWFSRYQIKSRKGQTIATQTLSLSYNDIFDGTEQTTEQSSTEQTTEQSSTEQTTEQSGTEQTTEQSGTEQTTEQSSTEQK